jgi:hypothetical protein
VGTEAIWNHVGVTRVKDRPNSKKDESQAGDGGSNFHFGVALQAAILAEMN